MLEVCYGARGLSHRAGDPSRTLNGKNMCLSSPRIVNQENLHSDGGSKDASRQAPSTRRASTGCRTHDLLGPSGQTGSPHGYGEGCPLREATPGKVQQGYGSYRMRPFVKAPQQYFNFQKFAHMARTCWRETKTCRYCAGGHKSHNRNL